MVLTSRAFSPFHGVFFDYYFRHATPATLTSLFQRRFAFSSPASDGFRADAMPLLRHA